MRLGARSRPAVTGFGGFLHALTHERPRELAWVITVQSAAALGQAVGVLLLIPLLGAVGVTASGGVARWMRHLFADLGITPTLATVLAIYVAVTAASAALNAYQGALSTRYRLEFVDHLRGRLYSAVAEAEWRHLIGLRQSDVLTALTVSVSWVGAAAYSALTLMVSAISVSALVAAAIGVSPDMTALAIATGAALLLIVWPLTRISRRLGAELADHNQSVLAKATGFLDGLKLAKAFGREQDHVDAFNSAVGAARRSQVQFAWANGIATGTQTALTAVLLGITVYVGIRLLHVPASSLLVVAFVFTRVISQLTASQTHMQQLAQGIPSFDQMMRLIVSSEGAREKSASQPRRALRVSIGEGMTLSDVQFDYSAHAGRAVAALRGVSMHLPAGSLVGLAGPSGAGKTTVADLAAGLLEPTGGFVTVGGQRLTPERLLSWRLSVALVPQDPFLFHDTVETNLRWARPEAAEAELWRVLQMASAADFVRRLPGGLQAVVGDRGLRISGGERQRLALARALLRDPDLLILDEATSSLDTETDLAIRGALASLRGRTTVLLIAHRVTTLREADEIVVLDAGRVVEKGTWHELSRLRLGRLQALIDAGTAAVPEHAGSVSHA